MYTQPLWNSFNGTAVIAQKYSSSQYRLYSQLSTYRKTLLHFRTSVRCYSKKNDTSDLHILYRPLWQSQIKRSRVNTPIVSKSTVQVLNLSWLFVKTSWSIKILNISKSTFYVRVLRSTSDVLPPRWRNISGSNFVIPGLCRLHSVAGPFFRCRTRYFTLVVFTDGSRRQRADAARNGLWPGRLIRGISGASVQRHRPSEFTPLTFRSALNWNTVVAICQYSALLFFAKTCKTLV